MPLDPRAQRLLHMLAASAADAPMESAEDRRRSLINLAQAVGGEAPAVAAVEDLQLPGPGGPLTLRQYRPDDARRGAILMLHGGGWVAGDLDTHDGVCRRLANASGQQVFALDYRRAPEHPFPAAFLDALATIRWMADRAGALDFDADKLVVAGDSAGGDLAAAACLALRDGGPLIALQLLICPILDLTRTSASHREFAEGYFLSRSTLERDLSDYVPTGANLLDPRLSPLHAADVSRLPPTHIHTAQFDPFRDEGAAFAARLQAAGIATSLTQHAGMIHYFYAMPGALPYAEKAMAEIGAAVKTALGD